MPRNKEPSDHQDLSTYGSARAPAVVASRPAPTRPKYSLVGDIYRGAVWGDFSPSIGIPGAVTQALLGYVPVVGTATALRDAVADWRGHDGVGLILNIFAAFPVLGGLAKTADVLHVLHRLHRAYTGREKNQEGETAVRPRHGLGCLAFVISATMIVLGIFYGLGIHFAAQYARTAWPLNSNTLFIGNGILVATIGLAALGLSVGEVICAGSRAWFGVIFLPVAMFIGLLLAGGV
jgi:hypothetical protein